MQNVLVGVPPLRDLVRLALKVHGRVNFAAPVIEPSRLNTRDGLSVLDIARAVDLIRANFGLDGFGKITRHFII